MRRFMFVCVLMSTFAVQAGTALAIGESFTSATYAYSCSVVLKSHGFVQTLHMYDFDGTCTDSQGNGPSRFASESAPQLVKVREAPAATKAGDASAPPPEQAKASASGPPKASPLLPPPPPPERQETTSTRRIVGLALVGAGVLVAGGGVFSHVLSEDDWARATKLAEEGKDRQAFEQAKSDSDAKLVAVVILYAAGGACAIAGAVLALTAPSASPAAQVSVRPAAGPGGFSMLVEGRF